MREVGEAWHAVLDLVAGMDDARLGMSGLLWLWLWLRLGVEVGMGARSGLVDDAAT